MIFLIENPLVVSYWVVLGKVIGNYRVNMLLLDNRKKCYWSITSAGANFCGVFFSIGITKYRPTM